MLTHSASVLDAPSRLGDSPLGTSPSTQATRDRLIKLMKNSYQADQQVKYLHLQAEVDSLLQQLQLLKQQRQNSVTPDADHQD